VDRVDRVDRASEVARLIVPFVVDIESLSLVKSGTPFLHQNST